MKNTLLAWAKQPTTLLAFAICLASIVYWFTGSPGIAAAAAAALLGGVDDHTQELLHRVETIEDAARPIVARPASVVAEAEAAVSAVVAKAKPAA